MYVISFIRLITREAMENNLPKSTQGLTIRMEEQLGKGKICC
jgi:hypothetical protein